jgi:uncharacterized protein YndB with AHSA1/START domain
MNGGDAITVTRVLKASRALVFEAWTRPEIMTQWFFPEPGWTSEVTSDLRVGGGYRLVMSDTKGQKHVQFGEYREIVPVSRLAFTWNCPDLGVVDSLVTVALAERGPLTELELTHVLPPEASPAVRRGHEDGWNGCIGSLERTLLEMTERRST